MLTGNIAGGSRPDVMCPLLALVSLASLVGCALLVTDFSSLQRVDLPPEKWGLEDLLAMIQTLGVSPSEEKKRLAADDTFAFFRNDGNLNWHAVREECRKRGGDLASIHNADEHSRAFAVVPRPSVAWLGMHAENASFRFICPDGEVGPDGLPGRCGEGEFLWSDGSPFDYTAWAEYFPNNGFATGGFAEDCGGFVKPSPPITPYSGCGPPCYFRNGGSRWADMSCYAPTNMVTMVHGLPRLPGIHNLGYVCRFPWPPPPPPPSPPSPPPPPPSPLPPPWRPWTPPPPSPLPPPPPKEEMHPPPPLKPPGQ